MNNTEQAFRKINDFFDTYARALEQHDTKLMAYHYYIPCTFLSDESTTLFTEASKLEGLFNQGLVFYRQFGLAHAQAEIWNKQLWTDKIAKVKINWQYFNKNKQPIYNCDYHYILKLDKHDQWKITMSVSVNEKERMETWMNGKNK